jgi:hypothetical protein
LLLVGYLAFKEKMKGNHNSKKNIPRNGNKIKMTKYKFKKKANRKNNMPQA